jgi:hypothetical protein
MLFTVFVITEAAEFRIQVSRDVTLDKWFPVCGRHYDPLKCQAPLIEQLTQ